MEAWSSLNISSLLDRASSQPAASLQPAASVESTVLTLLGGGEHRASALPTGCKHSGHAVSLGVAGTKDREV